jgi:hypothetical protein
MGDAAKAISPTLGPRTITDAKDPEIDVRALANQGMAEWLTALPNDDWSDALDESAFRSVRWVDGVGFVEVPT